MGDIRDRIDGVVIGIFLGFDESAPLVVFPGNPQETAATRTQPDRTDVGDDWLGGRLAVSGRRSAKPLIVGRIVDPVANRRATGRARRRDGSHNRRRADRTALRQGDDHHGKGRPHHDSRYLCHQPR